VGCPDLKSRDHNCWKKSDHAPFAQRGDLDVTVYEAPPRIPAFSGAANPFRFPGRLSRYENTVRGALL